MTLERHRSALLPFVEYGPDGSLIVTSGDGTHSIRSGKKETVIDDDAWTRAEDKLRQLDGLNLRVSKSYAERQSSVPDGKSPTDKDGGVAHKKPAETAGGGSPRYKRRPGGDMYATIGSGTVSTANSSLLRRLKWKRSKPKRRASDLQGYSIDKSGHRHRSKGSSASDFEQNAPSNEFWREMVAEKRRSASEDGQRKHRRKSTVSGSSSRHRRGGTSSRSSESRFSGGPPRMNPENAEFTRSNSYGSSTTRTELVGRDIGRRTRADACLAVLFVVVGCLLVAVGVVRILVCYWHEFGSCIWAGILVLVFGSMHAAHARDYQKHAKTLSYIILGVITSAAVLVASAFSLIVVVPILGQVTAVNVTTDSLDERSLSAVNFSKFSSNKTVIEVASVTWPSVALDLASLVLLVITFYSQTATVIAIDNYWDYNFKITADCGYGARPRLFNPTDQMSIGQATIFVGFIEISFMEYLGDHDPTGPHAWSMIWSGAMLIVAGFSGMCYGKRIDSKAAGIVSTVLQIVSLLASAATTVLTTLSIAKDADRLRIAISRNANSPVVYSVTNLAALVGIQAVAVCICIVVVVFDVGSLFRHITQLCCARSHSNRHSRHYINGDARRSGTSSNVGA